VFFNADCNFLENDKTYLYQFFQGFGENTYTLQTALKNTVSGL